MFKTKYMNIKTIIRQNCQHTYNTIRMGDFMKKILFVTILLIIIPYTMINLLKPKNIQEKRYIKENSKIVRVKRDKKNIIEKIPIEKYLVGVIAGEMPVSYDLEALKAQAVAARTYTLKKIEQNKNKDYDVVDTTNDQVYIDEQELKDRWKENYNQNIKKIKQAVKETMGEYLTYDGKIITAFFFSTSSGKTENCQDVFGESLPYLVSVSSTWDETSPSYENEIIISKEEFCKKIEITCDEIKIDIQRNETNSIKKITINDKILKGTEFRFKLGLRSTNIEIEQNENEIKIKSKGYGHGVGMSQYGAYELAKQGYKYNDILKYYYKGIEFKKI